MNIKHGLLLALFAIVILPAAAPAEQAPVAHVAATCSD
jgi:hypothetical protein